MSYAATEIDKYLASPVELYEFNQVNVDVFRYTSGNQNVLSGGFTYTAIPLKRSGIEQSQNISRGSIKIDMPRSIPFVTGFIAAPPSNVISVTIRRFHRLDPIQEIIILWQGRVVNVDFRGDICQVVCDPRVTAMNRLNLRRVYQISCPHILYRAACGVDEVNYQQNATLSAVSGTDLTSSTFGGEANGYWKGGVVRITKSGMPHIRAILDHSGNDIEIDLTIPGLSVGDVVVAAPGCDRSIATCESKFNNELNHGGYPYIPIKNPMGAGTPIW